MKTIKYITILFLLSPLVGFATEHTTRLHLNNQSVSLTGGDVYNINGESNAIYANNNSSINISPSDAGITVNALRVSEAMSMRVLLAQNNSTVDLGSGSKLSLTSSGTSGLVNTVIQIGLNSHMTATNLEITGSGGGSDGVLGVNVGLDSTLDLGTNSIVRTDGTALTVSRRGVITAADAYVDAGRTALSLWLGSINLQNTTVIGGEAAVNFIGRDPEITASAGDVSVVNFSGGSLYSTSGPVVRTSSGGAIAQDHDMILNITDGAQASSNSGVLYSQNASTVATTGIDFTLNVEGTGTKVEGVFLGDTVETNFNISDSATWASTGSSNIDNLSLDNANLEFDMTSISDSITTGNLTLEGHSEALIGFTNDFLEEIIAAGGSMNDIDASIVTSFLDGDGDITYIYKTSNDEGSTWDIVNHGDGTFDISNINIIPEPSTYALIFGLLALTFATYRRRK